MPMPKFFVLGVLLSLSSIAIAQNERPDKVPVHLSGLLLDDNGNAISGGQLQIWQTDTMGIYDHPNSLRFAEDGLDTSFQYYGTATSEEDGSFEFLTIRPEHYPMRPQSHIHFKIFVEDDLVLTTQMYFQDENFGYPDSLQLELTHREEGGFSTQKDIVVDLGNGGDKSVTPSQPSGPYYPVVDFFHIGNNLILADDGTALANSTISDIEPPIEEIPTEDSITETVSSEDSETSMMEEEIMNRTDSSEESTEIVTSTQESFEESELSMEESELPITEASEELESSSEEGSSFNDFTDELGSPTKDDMIAVESTKDTETVMEDVVDTTRVSLENGRDLVDALQADSSAPSNKTKFVTWLCIQSSLFALLISLV